MSDIPTTTNLDHLKVFVYLGSINSRRTGFGFTGEGMTAFVFSFVSLHYFGKDGGYKCVSVHTGLSSPLYSHCIFFRLFHVVVVIRFWALEVVNSKIHVRSKCQ